MKCVLLLLLVTNLSGQSARQDQSRRPGAWQLKEPTSVEGALDSTLAALRERDASQSRLSQQLAHVMMRVADNDRQPAWPVLVSFTDKLTRELTGRQLDIVQIRTIRDCLIGVMRRAGTSTAGLASRLQQTFAAIGIDSSKTQLVVTDFIAVGEAVRGPDDSPVRQ